jgi:hypothetical protein
VILLEGCGQIIGILLLVTSTMRFYNGMGVHVEKAARPIRCFRNPLRPIPNLTTCPSSSGAREPIPVVILLNLPIKKRVLVRDVSVSNVRERWAGC